MKDYYQILGIGDRASLEDIRDRWVELTEHDQRGSEGDERIREIHEAYQNLKTANLKFEYDLRRNFRKAVLRHLAYSREQRRSRARRVTGYCGLLAILLVLGSLALFLEFPGVSPKNGGVVIPEGARIADSYRPSESAKKPEKPEYHARLTEEILPAPVLPESPGKIEEPPAISSYEDEKASEALRGASRRAGHEAEGLNEAARAAPPETRGAIIPPAPRAAPPPEMERKSEPVREPSAPTIRPEETGGTAKDASLEASRKEAPPKAMESSALLPAEETRKPEPVREASAAPAKKLEEPGATAKNISTELSRKEALAGPREGPASFPPPAMIQKSELPKESLATAVKIPEERGGAAKDSLVEPSRTGIPQAPLEGLAASALEVGRKSEPPKEAAVAGVKRPEERGGGAAKDSLVEPSRRIGPPEARESPAAFPPEVKRKPEPMKEGPAPSIQDRSLPPREAKIPTPSSVQTATAREAEVKQFLARYIDRYNRKDIDGFISFFSPKAVQNQKEDIEKIRKVYATFFQHNEELRYKVSNVKIDPHKDGLLVMADYELEGVLKKGKERKVWKGQVRWVLMKEEGGLKVLSLDYQPQKSRD